MIRVALGNQFPHLEGNHKEVGVSEVISYTPIKCPTDFTDLHRFSFILKIHPCKAENVFGWRNHASGVNPRKHNTFL